jgi:ATP-dependent protease ClpP protease subunit
MKENEMPKKDEKPEVEEQSEIKKTIDDFGTINNAFDFRSNIQYLTIIGSIEGHGVLPPQDKTTKYENIIPQLVAVEENDNIKGLLTILNTVGGDVEAGLAIAPIRLTGLVIGAQQTFDYFKKMQDRVVDFIVRTSKADRETVLAYMNATGNIANDVGTILFSSDATKIGLIDEVGGLRQALSKLKSMIQEEQNSQQ